MKEKNSGTGRFLTFALLTIILVLVAGIAVSGMQAPITPPDEEAPPTEDTPALDDNKENEDGTIKEENPEQSITTPPPVIELPKFYNPMTGLETSEQISKNAPIGFVLNSSMPLYGISNSDLTIEFPTEDGTTRLLTYTTNDALLWKVGSLAPTRSFISGMSNFFGGLIVSYGKDDIINYGSFDSDKYALDIKEYQDCFYIENQKYVYTSKEKTDELIRKNNIINNFTYKSTPFEFLNDDEVALGNTSAVSLTLPYADAHRTELQYSDITKSYLYFKDGNRKIDMLSGKNVSFTNLFILFANTTTYEKSEGTELVIDTSSGGNGYYVSMGTKTEITWSVSQDGRLEFKSLDGEILKINRGNSYIGYYKSSQTGNVVFY
jgi:hypothetical protein